MPFLGPRAVTPCERRIAVPLRGARDATMVSSEFLDLKPKEAPKTALQVKTKEELQQDIQDAMERAKARITARKLSEAAAKMRAQQRTHLGIKVDTKLVETVEAVSDK